MISEKHRNLVNEKVQNAIKDGATLVTGGNNIEGKGFYYAPTLLTDVKQNNSIIHTEVLVQL